jgi:hypothetical protein
MIPLYVAQTERMVLEFREAQNQWAREKRAMVSHI